MNPQRALRACVIICAGILAVAVASSVWASDEGEEAAAQVSQTSYYGFLNNSLYTHVGNSRGPNGAQLIPCRNNIQSLMQSYGLSVALEPFTYGGTTYHNVVGTKTGTVYPNQMYIVGGHYDSVSNPGADDNASGVALVLEAARILSQYPSDYTIKFIGFSMEEAGLVGSQAYVDSHVGAGILGMISTDMVAYDPNTNHALIYGRTASNPIKNSLAAAVPQYSGGLTYTIGGDVPQSDHAPFEADGYQACLWIEGEVWNNPYYHTQQDNFEQAGNLNFPYAVKMTKVIVGWLVDQAGVQVPVNKLAFSYPNGRPQFVHPALCTEMRVEVTGVGTAVPQPGTGMFHYNTGAGWQSAAMEVVADNVYDALFPLAPCGTSIQYYVSALAVGGQEFKDPRDAPAVSYAATSAVAQNVAYNLDLNTNPGWTVQGQWAYGHPTGGGGEYGNPDPANGYTGSNVYGYNLAGDYPNNLSETHLTSTAFNCTGLFDVHLKFWRWLGVEQPLYDHAYVRISTNGTSWTTVWQNTTEVTDSQWVQMDLDISSIADNQPTLYLRWTMGTTDGGWRYCGWNIDDIQLTALQCSAPCPDPADGDMNGIDGTNGEDIAGFVGVLLGTCPSFDEICHADFTGEQQVDVADINGMVAALLAP